MSYPAQAKGLGKYVIQSGDGTLTYILIPVQKGFKSYGNEGVPRNLQISRNRASPTDTVLCHPRTPYFGRSLTHSIGYS